ncbi:hypothetical protein R6242_16050 [Iodobacter sp. CM08]|uniref:pilus assembly FimT family protein n=1 Tax=Iodobacter sp. CM08 TaxID=3085902 RepID=UPI0029819926|nr:hypothetical protein [Iodobacter sp. CM08]MDW5418079.1 hypothetical protein [Iodobacter sp. CM08]
MIISHKKSHHIQHDQHGFGLLTSMGALLIAGLLMGMAISWMSEQAKTQALNVYQNQLKELAKTIDSTYFSKKYSELINYQPIPGFANPLAPTIAELRNAKLIRSDFPDAGKFGGNFVIEIARAPAGCVMPTCDLQAIIRGSSPILNAEGRPDTIGAASLVQKGGGDFAATTTNAGIFQGPDASWSSPNPVNRLAMVAVRIGYNASGWGAFVRTDGTSAINGNQVINGTAIINGTQTINGNIAVSGTTQLNGNTVAKDLTAQDLTFRNGTASGNVNVAGSTTLQDMLYKNATGSGNHTVNGSNTVGGSHTVFGDFLARAHAFISGNSTIGGQSTVWGASNLQNVNVAGQVQAGGNVSSGGAFYGNGGGLNNIQYAAKAGWADGAGWATNATNATNAANATVAGTANFANEALSVKCQNISNVTSGSPCRSMSSDNPPPQAAVQQSIAAKATHQIATTVFDRNCGATNDPGETPVCSMDARGVLDLSPLSSIPDPGYDLAGGYFTKCSISLSNNPNSFINSLSVDKIGPGKMINGYMHYQWKISISVNTYIWDHYLAYYNNFGNVDVSYTCLGYNTYY